MKRRNLLPLALLFAACSLQAQNYAPAGDRIMTKWGEAVTPANVWQEYPRPQLQRETWLNLNGLWEYSLLSKTEAEPSNYQGEILVPFCLESALSGVGKKMLPEDRLWYRKSFELPANWKENKVILHFEAVDWSAVVWVNGVYVGAHKGAYDRFSFDISPYLSGKEKQKIVVAVDDPSSFGAQARGKQQMPQQGIWYTPVSGIWQTVWLEAVHKEASIGEVKIVPDVDRQLVKVSPLLLNPKQKGYQVQVSVLEKGEEVASALVPADQTLELELKDPTLWSPDHPFLYGLTLTLLSPENKELDHVESYFGMRKISLGLKGGKKVMFLNNTPLFHYGPLDQGWWPDGLHTPPSDEAMSYDIEMTKAMGFNMIRKHIKVEPDRWFYHCDRLGMLVWQDMPSGMAVVPVEEEERPLYIQNLPRKDGLDLNRRSEVAAQFEWELRRMIDLHFNAPSIVMWIPFNEGWGQYATCRISETVKALDPTRLVNASSGWSLHPCGDIWDIHSYQVEVHVPPLSIDMASVLGEYGGIGYPVEGHQWDAGMRNWGYQTYHSAEELLKNYTYKFDQIVEMFKSKGLSAAVYTQTTDVEGEVNGLMTYDRKVIKMPLETLMEMHSVLYEK